MGTLQEQSFISVVIPTLNAVATLSETLAALVRRLGRRRLGRIGARCLASARRYRQDGYFRRPLRNLLCLSLYLAGVPPARIVRLYG
jgi:hypothetical protein